MQTLVTPAMGIIIRQFFLLLTLSFINFSIQGETLWQEKSPLAKSEHIKPLRVLADKARYIQINQSLLTNKFSNLNLATEITVPLPNGLSITVKLSPSPILSEDLAKQYPNFMAYQAQQVDQPQNIGRFSISHLGLFGFFRYNNQWMLLSPRYQGEAIEYASYWYKDAPSKSEKATLTADFLLAEEQIAGPELAQKLVTTGDKVRTYSLAISTTGEYTQKLGGTTQNVIAELMNLVNRINQVVLVDLAIQFELVDNQDIIFFDAATDPYTNTDAATDIEENQSVVDQAIGNQNYDIGHVLGTNGGGLAYVGVVCNSQFKAQGYTGLDNPQGERFYIDLVAHELGHQLGAGHTFNATNSSNCEQNGRSIDSAFEPGSGSTIMSYAGICGSQNIQDDSDPYFHSISIQEIRTYVESFSGRRCGVEVEIENAIPKIQLPQNAYTIPAATPFVLSATATDANNDFLSFTWEQFDNGGTLGATSSLAEMNIDNGSNPLFRSFSPVGIAQRYFPKLSDVLRGQTTKGETYATTDRDMRFRLTARDNNGGVNQQDVVITVANTSQTFSIATPNEWQALFEQAVTWNMGDTLTAPINCANVDILVIADVNNPIETTVLLKTPNDGQQIVRAPNISSAAARLVLRCSDNVFYAVSDQTFAIIDLDPVAPLINSQNVISLNEDSQRQIDLADLNVTDPDSAYPQDFTLTIQEGNNYTVNQQILTPDADFYGTLTVPVTVNDGGLDSNVFTLQVQVLAVNDAPVVTVNNQSSISLNEDSQRIIDFSDLTIVDPDSAYPEDFTLTIQDGDNYSIDQQTLTPDTNFNGVLAVKVVVNDGELDSNLLILQVLVVAVNDAPIASSDSLDILSINEDSQRQFDFTDIKVIDPDSDYPGDFSLTIQNGENYSVSEQTLTPNANFNGTLNAMVFVNDGELDSNVLTFQVQVTALNDAPIANDDTASIQQNSDTTVINVLSNDTDVDLDELSITSFSYTGEGQVAVLNQQLTYTPAAGFTGNESIIYVISDGTLTDEASLNVQVNSVPVVSGDSGDSGGGSMLLLSFLSFLCFSVKLYQSINKGRYE
ncbi:tandem-95 repeat protein [Paraglaciecola arctica]|uniref:PPE repeat-containing protein n=1 Tax=Paraglaciecola arctica BSs20135 TaxID=493475 RepID=K6Z6L4_9ALTE|nr:tandem-95 repeat protein [Paraglaciecola arctica]GAC19090.1 PPE repeat-containing protein [Paraglaciecola arctica BSs20135]